MAHTFLRSMQIYHGTTGEGSPEEGTAEGDEALYTTPQEMDSLYGCCLTRADIRAAMTLISTEIHRPTLWPAEYDSGIIEVPPDRYETRLPLTPVIQITELAGRYGLGRRDRTSWNGLQANIATYLVMVGGTPTWSPIPIEQCELDSGTGVLYVQPSWLLAPYTLIRAKYISGYLTIPDPIKMAIVEIVNTMHNKGVSDRTRYNVGKISRTFASDSFITPLARQLLAPFVVTTLL